MRRDQQSPGEGANSEERYQAIFNSMTEGFAVHELIMDANGRACDYRFLDLNPAFEKLTGLKRADVIGRRVREVIPGLEDEWVETFGRVVLTGQPIRFERYAAALERWYEVFAFKYGSNQFAVIFLDVSARVQSAAKVEQALAEVTREKLRLEAVMQAVPIGLALLDEKGGNRQANPAFDKVWGKDRPPTGSVADYSHYRAWWVDSGLPVQPEEWASARAVHKGDTVVGQLMQIERFDGTRAFVLNSAAPIFDANGQITGSAVVIMDVTDRISAEEKLEEAKRLLDALMENVPEGITIADAPGGKIRIVSKYGQTLLGTEHDQMTIDEVASRWTVYRSDGVTPMPSEEVPLTRAIQKGETVRDEEIVQVNSKGERLTLACNAAPIRNKNQEIVGGVAAWRDVTDRKRAEEALRNSERLYRAIGESIDYGVWVCAPDGRNLYASKSFLDLVGLTQEQCSNFGWGDVLHPDDSARTIAAWKECVRTGGTWDIEHRYRGVDGEWHSILARGVPVRDESGQVICWAGINLDISRLKEAEEQLKEINETLEQRVLERTALAEERTRQLRIVAAELNRIALRERQRLAQVLHDDLQQTLVGAKFNLGVIKRSAGTDELSTAIAQVMNLLDKAVMTSRSLTAELSPPVLQVGTMRQVLEWVADSAKQQFGLDVEVQVENDVDVEAQELRYILFRAVRELLLNVAKHAQTGKAVVKMAAAGTDQIQISVSDQGVGFAPQQLTAALSYQSSAGSRLGLFTVRERIEFLGGLFDIVSQPGSGTEVIIVVPCRIAQEGIPTGGFPTWENLGPTPSGVESRAESLPPESNIRVLLADDHAVLRDGLDRLLSAQKGIEVVAQAADGVEAVELALKHRPDVILMDISMPRLDGIEATRQICERFPGIKVIGLSMHEEKDAAEKMAAAGAVRYITKTVAHEVLIAAIREVVRPA